MSAPQDFRSARNFTSEVKEMKQEEEDDTSISSLRDSRSSSARMADNKPKFRGAETITSQHKAGSTSNLPLKSSASPSPAVKSDVEIETIGGDVTVTLEPGKAPKLSRKASQKVISRPPTTFSHLDDATDEATSTFEVMRDCHYQLKHLGNTEHALECDCQEEWDPKAKANMACGEDTDCINRATKMECPGDCGCGADCQNQRFQQKRYADVSVIKTDKKGFGLRANADLKPNEFIFEYIGEVITESAFRKRMLAYDEEGIKHFYFMSLSKSEFVDATKKGNLGRFCNHSCNPNCYVDKWVVGEKLRMGIFAERHIQSGEELVFNYNVDRYGADPQPCYCNEPNCSGFIGGKTQTGTDSGIQLSGSLQQALGLTSNDGWSDAVSHKPKRKKKASEDDEEYVDSVELSELDHVSVMPLVGELYKNQEKWVVVKLLQRIQKSTDPRVLTRVGALHGYTVMQKLLKQFPDDSNVVLQVFDVLDKIPKMSKNKIEDAGIEQTVESILATTEDERVKDQGTGLLEAWSKLERTYRIPKRERDPNAAPAERRNERPDRRERNRSRSRSRSRSKSPEPIKAPSGPRNPHAQRPFNNGPRPQFRPRAPPNGPLPPGWFEAKAQNGTTYYYNTSGATTWQRPTLPAHNAPPPPPPKAVTESQSIQSIIDNIVSLKKAQATPEPARNGSIRTSATPAETPRREKKKEPWRDLPIEKQKKIFASTLVTHAKPVMNKFSGKLDKVEFKRVAKEITNNLVEDYYQRKFVEDPNELVEERKDKVTKLFKKFFERALVKQREREKRNASSVPQSGGNSTPAETPSTPFPVQAVEPAKSQDDDAMELSDHEDEDDSRPRVVSDTTTVPLKRRYDEADNNGETHTDDGVSKKTRMEEELQVAPPPPPPQPAGSPNAPMLSEDTYANGGSVDTTAKAGDSEDGPGFTIRGVAGNLTKLGQSPTQVATPPTTGSPDGGERVKEQAEFSGMNPERLRRLSEPSH